MQLLDARQTRRTDAADARQTRRTDTADARQTRRTDTADARQTRRTDTADAQGRTAGSNRSTCLYSTYSPLCACASRFAGSTYGAHRALRAFRPSRHAYQRSQLHDRLIELPGAFAVFGDQTTGELPDLAGCGMRDAGCGPATTHPASRITHPEEHASNHPRHIRVDRRHGLFVGERCHRAGGVRSDSRELDELVGMVWQRATEVLTDHARKRVEIGGAGVIAQPVPLLSHSPGLRFRERLEVREPIDEPRIVLRHATHLRLLQHELGHEHAIGVARAAPGQVARGAGPPGEQLATEPHPLSPSPQCGEGGRRAGIASPLSTTWRGGQGVRGRRTGHGSPRYCTWQTGRSSRLTRCDWSRARASARSTTWDASASSWPICSAASPSGVSGSSGCSSRRSRWATAPSSSCCSWRRSRAPSRASRPAISSPARCRCTTRAPSSPNR